MDSFKWRVRVSVLWVFQAVAMSAYWLLELVEPGAIEELMAGRVGGTQISSGLLVFFSLFWLVPLSMAFLSLILERSANRWANTILGVVWVALGIVAAVGEVAGGDPSAALLLVDAAMFVALGLIVWHGWRWPVEER